jgi:UDP-glucose 4-epimerase
MKHAVIGGAGFIGHHIVNKLINRGDDVVVIDNLSTGFKENVNEKARFHQFDITDNVAVKVISDLLHGVDTVYLTAALARVQPSMEDPITFNKVNVDGVLNVLEAARKANVRRVVYSASSSAYGDTNVFPTPEEGTEKNPLSPYGLQKYIGEQYCKLYSQIFDLDTVSLRYFNVYGEGMPLEGAYRTVISIFGEQYKSGMPLTYTNDGEQRRDFTYVGDVVSANILAGDNLYPLNGDVFNVGNGNNYSVNEVMDMFGGTKQFLENRIEPSCTLADNSKLRNKFGWEPKGDLPAFIEQYKKDLKS